jgi:hypothetical protein
MSDIVPRLSKIRKEKLIAIGSKLIAIGSLMSWRTGQIDHQRVLTTRVSPIGRKSGDAGAPAEIPRSSPPALRATLSPMGKRTALC